MMESVVDGWVGQSVEEDADEDNVLTNHVNEAIDDGSADRWVGRSIDRSLGQTK